MLIFLSLYEAELHVISYCLYALNILVLCMYFSLQGHATLC